MAQPEGFCTLCNLEIPSFEGLTECPNCGTHNRPCSYADALEVKINLHELHILCVWAERWGMKIAEEGDEKSGPGTIYAIVQRLKQNNESLKDRTLTLAGELEGLRDAGYQFRTNIPGVEDNVD